MELMVRVGQAAGVESTFVESVLRVACDKIGDALKTGEGVEVGGVGWFYVAASMPCRKSVVVKGGGRSVKNVGISIVVKLRAEKRKVVV